MTINLNPPDREPEKPDLHPPDADFIVPQKRNLLFILLIAFSLFILLDIAVLAYFFLSDRAEKKQIPAQQQIQSAGQNREGEQERKDAEHLSVDSAARTSAEELRNQWLKLQAVAEADDISTWGGPDFTVITNKAEEAERLFTGDEYLPAGERFQEAITALAELQEARPMLLADSLKAGAEALAAENSAAAAKAFTRALALAPGNRQAGHGLARAQTLQQVLALYNKGLDYEKAGKFKEAEDALSRAQKIDPEFHPAVQALAKVRARQEESAFQLAMGGFLQAMTVKKTDVAQSALDQAARLRPQSPAVAESRKQLQQLVAEQTLARLQQEYIQFASSEQWQQAQERCEQALKVDPQASFALIGLQAATRRLKLDQALQGILEHPQRLQEQGPLQEARQTLAAAESVTDPGPRLTEQLNAVKKQLEAATRQVRVVLQSDNATEVVIYRVGRLGRFNQRELQLRPGRYTVVGSRPGYRDVRKVFEIHADDEQASLRIRCEEVI